MPNRSWRQALARTRRSAFGRLASTLGASVLIPGFWDQLETRLIQADLGAPVALPLLDESQVIAREQGLARSD